MNNPLDVHKPGVDPMGRPWRNIRECIQEVNLSPNAPQGPDRIKYDALAFDASNDCVTLLGSPLPRILEAVDISGWVQGKNRPQVKSPGGFRVIDIWMPPERHGEEVSLTALVVTDGDALGAASPADPFAPHGGGVRAVSASLSLRGTSVTNNTANGDGGGVYAVGQGCVVHLMGSDCVIAANTAGENGGGIATGNCQVKMNQGAKVKSNTAGKSGGGIAVLANHFAMPGGAAPVILNIDGTFQEDHTVFIQGNVAMNGDGGGVFVQNIAGAPPIANLKGAVISGNRADGPIGGLATGRGGGVAALGALELNGDETVSVTANFQRTNAGVLGAYLAPGVGGTFATDADVFGNFLIQ